MTLARLHTDRPHDGNSNSNRDLDKETSSE